MTPSSTRYLLRKLVLSVFCLSLWAAASFAAASPRQKFSIPADKAEKTLKILSEQSGRQVLFPTDAVEGVRTKAVAGEMTAADVLNKMLEGTVLVGIEDDVTGSLTVRREKSSADAEKKGARAAQPTASDRPRQSRSDAAAASPVEATDEIQLLSPFEVSSEKARGYYASSTMSGTRLNSKIEDLASSISIVTKEMMSDFALLDINDIFNYEASTEGLGNYTDIVMNPNGEFVDNSMLSPNTANRIRGISSANISLGNYETSRRVPIDPSNIDSVEISRGPNSNIFGLGNAGGTVNLVAASSNLSRNTSQVQFRADSYGGYRSSLDVNRVLKPGKLAVRGSAVFQHEGFVRKPSGLNTARLNGMFKAQPFKATSITGFYSLYRMNGNRPNYTLPRDGVTFWKNSGSPTWDPLSESYRLNGVLTRFPGGGNGRNMPVWFTNQNFIKNASGGGTALMGVDRDGTITHWTPSLSSAGNNPEAQDIFTFHYGETGTADIRTIQATQPLFATPPTMSGKDLYDWSSISLAAMNRSYNTTHTCKVELDHFFVNTRRQILAAQLGWFREDSKIRERALYGTPNGLTLGGTIHVDPNERLLDGTPNPNLLRPFIGLHQPLTWESPLLNDTYRGQLAYQLDLSQEKNLLRWLGLHRVVGYKEYKDFVTRRSSFTEAMVDDHAWLPPGTNRSLSNSIVRPYIQYYVGDNQGQNIDYAPGDFQFGTYPFRWGSAVTGNWRSEPAQLGLAATTRSTGGGANVRRVLKTEGLNLQSHFLGSRIVTTFGWRDDRSYTKRGVGARLLPDGLSHDYAWNNQWESGDWLFRQGRTKTAGIVVKPLRWLSFHANTSDNFLPASPAKDIYLNELPDPFNQGEDIGFSLNLFDGKLIVRATRHITKQLRSRTTTLIQTVRRVDIWDGSVSRPFGLNLRARNWLRNANPGFSEQQLDAEVAKTMQMSVDQMKALEDTTLVLADWNDAVAKGNEIEVACNPWSHWTVKLNVSEQESINTTLSDSLSRWVDERTPIWESITDLDNNAPWYNWDYNNNRNGGGARDNLRQNFNTQFKVARALLGKSLPQIRRYRANVSTNLRLAGVTDHRILKRFNVGGALRWEDKGAIGYYGLQQLPEMITDLDPNRPVWAEPNLRADAFIGYRTRLIGDKVGATFQLNIRNIQDSGKLQAISAFPDGTPNGYRIVDPRQFILTVTFDL